MKKFAFFLAPLMAITFLTNCGNSVKWVSKSVFKEKINEYFSAKPFNKYLGYRYTQTYKGEIYSECKIDEIKEENGIYKFVDNTSREYSITYSNVILSPDLADYDGPNERATNYGLMNNGNFLIRMEGKKISEFFNVFYDRDIVFNKELVIVHSSSTQRVGNQKMQTIELEHTYTKLND